MAVFRTAHWICHGFASHSRAALRLTLGREAVDIRRFTRLEKALQEPLSFTSGEPFFI
jgi:hypothetical protein